jgi:predicted phage terminase large subunit-like protein
LKALILDPLTRVVRVSTYANLDNLDPNFRRTVIQRYEGTRIGRQELHGEVLADVEGALWNFDMIVPHRLPQIERLEDLIPTFERIVVGIDPAGTSKARSDETGIIVAGKRGRDLYVLADASGKYTPSGWAKKATDLYEHWQADAIIAENNYGGEMVRSTLLNEQAAVRIKEVNSRRGKLIRAEPIVSLYEQGLVHHALTLAAVSEGLEEQMTEWVPGKGDSPDRVDALVHALTELADNTGESEIATASGIIVPSPGRRGMRSPNDVSATFRARPTRPTVRSWS